jgi:hypothetical protein
VRRPRPPLAGATLLALVGTFVLTASASTAALGAGAGGSERARPDEPAAAAQMGPLRVLARNPRYFTDGSGRAVYLTGSHVWWNGVGDRSWRVAWDCAGGAARPFDYTRYLDRIAGYGQNFVRLWRHELTRWEECGETVTIDQQPWIRSGPGTALDGLPKFDLDRWDETYFERLRARVEAARARGVYVSVMLFEGWSVRSAAPPWRWEGHPFHAANNVNGIDGDADGNGAGVEIHTLAVPAVTALQEAYVRKVVEAVGDLENLLFEIVNESGPHSVPWQYHMIAVTRSHLRGRGLERPLGMTSAGREADDALWRSAADWISPTDPVHLHDPPVANGAKVVLGDTDHYCGLCLYPHFPWKALTRGLNPLFMDPLFERPAYEAKRRILGVTRRVAAALPLARMTPRPRLCSTGYCLAERGREYLVYQPRRGRFSVNLRGSRKLHRVVWIDAQTGARRKGRPVAGGRIVWLEPPRGGPAAVHVRAVR